MGEGHDSPIPTSYTPFPNPFLHTIAAIRKAGAADTAYDGLSR